MTIVVSTKLSDLTSGFRPFVQLSGGSTVRTFERELTYEEINPTAGKPLQQPQVRPFRYEDGSSPDELA